MIYWVAFKSEMVGRGYLNRPELTKEKFIPNPFGEGKLYKTGDLVRWERPGVLEYLGRIDRQVKIRGFRIELDEIENQMERFPGITGSVAKVFGNNLVAYVTPESVEVKKLVEHLLARLPKHSLPQKIVPLESFPINSSGKIDQAALADPFSTIERDGEEPKTIDEKKMAETWSGVLFPDKKNDEQIFLDDNFFDLGGNSLHVLKLIQNLRKRFSNPKITHELIFKFPILKDFLKGLKNWVPDENKYLEKGREVKFSSILKTIPTTIYFSMGFIFPFVAFSLLSIKFP